MYTGKVETITNRANTLPLGLGPIWRESQIPSNTVKRVVAYFDQFEARLPHGATSTDIIYSAEIDAEALLLQGERSVTPEVPVDTLAAQYLLERCANETVTTKIYEVAKKYISEKFEFNSAKLSLIDSGAANDSPHVENAHASHEELEPGESPKERIIRFPTGFYRFIKESVKDNTVPRLKHGYTVGIFLHEALHPGKRHGHVEEYQADEAAMRVMAELGMDPREYIEVMAMFENMRRGGGPSLAISHPDTSQRIARLERILADIWVDFPELIEQLAQRSEEDVYVDPEVEADLCKISTRVNEQRELMRLPASELKERLASARDIREFWRLYHYHDKRMAMEACRREYRNPGSGNQVAASLMLARAAITSLIRLDKLETDAKSHEYFNYSRDEMSAFSPYVGEYTWAMVAFNKGNAWKNTRDYALANPYEGSNYEVASKDGYMLDMAHLARESLQALCVTAGKAGLKIKIDGEHIQSLENFVDINKDTLVAFITATAKKNEMNPFALKAKDLEPQNYPIYYDHRFVTLLKDLAAAEPGNTLLRDYTQLTIKAVTEKLTARDDEQSAHIIEVLSACNAYISGEDAAVIIAEEVYDLALPYLNPEIVAKLNEKIKRRRREDAIVFAAYDPNPDVVEALDFEEVREVIGVILASRRTKTMQELETHKDTVDGLLRAEAFTGTVPLEMREALAIALTADETKIFAYIQGQEENVSLDEALEIAKQMGMLSNRVAGSVHLGTLRDKDTALSGYSYLEDLMSYGAAGNRSTWTSVTSFARHPDDPLKVARDGAAAAGLLFMRKLLPADVADALPEPGSGPGLYGYSNMVRKLSGSIAGRDDLIALVEPYRQVLTESSETWARFYRELDENISHQAIFNKERKLSALMSLPAWSDEEAYEILVLREDLGTHVNDLTYSEEQVIRLYDQGVIGPVEAIKVINHKFYYEYFKKDKPTSLDSTKWWPKAERCLVDVLTASRHTDKDIATVLDDVKGAIRQTFGPEIAAEVMLDVIQRLNIPFKWGDATGWGSQTREGEVIIDDYAHLRAEDIARFILQASPESFAKAKAHWRDIQARELIQASASKKSVIGAVDIINMAIHMRENMPNWENFKGHEYEFTMNGSLTYSDFCTEVYLLAGIFGVGVDEAWNSFYNMKVKSNPREAERKVEDEQTIMFWEKVSKKYNHFRVLDDIKRLNADICRVLPNAGELRDRLLTHSWLAIAHYNSELAAPASDILIELLDLQKGLSTGSIFLDGHLNRKENFYTIDNRADYLEFIKGEKYFSDEIFKKDLARRFPYENAGLYPYTVNSRLSAWGSMSAVHIFLGKRLVQYDSEIQALAETNPVAAIDRVYEVCGTDVPNGPADVYVEYILRTALKNGDVNLATLPDFYDRYSNLLANTKKRSGIGQRMLRTHIDLEGREIFFKDFERGLGDILDYLPEPSHIRNVFLDELEIYAPISPTQIAFLAEFRMDDIGVSEKKPKTSTEKLNELIDLIPNLDVIEKENVLCWLLDENQPEPQGNVFDEFEKREGYSRSVFRDIYQQSSPIERRQINQRLLLGIHSIFDTDRGTVEIRSFTDRFARLITDLTKAEERDRENYAKLMAVAMVSVRPLKLVDVVTNVINRIYEIYANGEDLNIEDLVYIAISSFKNVGVKAAQLIADYPWVDPKLKEVMQKGMWDNEIVPPSQLIRIWNNERGTTDPNTGRAYFTGWEIVRFNQPLGSAGISQVFNATMKFPDGEVREVAYNSVKPSLVSIYEVDQDLKDLKRFIDNLKSEGYQIDIPNEFVEIIRQVIVEERHKLDIAEFQAKYANSMPVFLGIDLHVPTIFASARRITLDEFIKGEVLAAAEPEETEIQQVLFRAMYDLVGPDGMIHLDPHKGNVMRLNPQVGYQQSLGLIDFGFRLDLRGQKELKKQITDMLFGLITGNDSAFVSGLNQIARTEIDIAGVELSGDMASRIEVYRRAIAKAKGKDALLLNKLLWWMYRVQAHFNNLQAGTRENLIQMVQMGYRMSSS